MEWDLRATRHKGGPGWGVHAPGLALVGIAFARDAEPKRPIK